MQNLIIGTVLKPQGIRGEIKIKSFTDYPEDVKKFKTVIIGGVSYKVLSCRVDAEAVFLMLRGIADRDAAEGLRGKNVEASREDAPALEKGVFYIVDLIGCKLVTEEGVELGILTDITSAATDIYTVKMGEKDVMFPAVKGVVVNTDIENQIITVNKKAFYEVAVL